MSVENSGLDCNYYNVTVKHLSSDTEPEYETNCADITEALGMTPNEANIFKEVWRSAAGRQGRQKKGHSQIRGAEKILWHAKRNLNMKKRGLK